MVPVPLHPKRLRERGFNQAEHLAAEVAKYLNSPICADALGRVRVTASQTALSRDERRANVQPAFAAIQPPQAGRVLLVDDVMSTGAIAMECARALRRSSVSEVVMASAAIAVLA